MDQSYSIPLPPAQKQAPHLRAQASKFIEKSMLHSLNKDRLSMTESHTYLMPTVVSLSLPVHIIMPKYTQYWEGGQVPIWLVWVRVKLTLQGLCSLGHSVEKVFCNGKRKLEFIIGQV